MKLIPVNYKIAAKIFFDGTSMKYEVEKEVGAKVKNFVIERMRNATAWGRRLTFNQRNVGKHL